ncbi:MAG: hypothetical protein LUH15_05445 [Tannerellaceae bacterium]|nr:hypothetical protein [Tannerellaceae bacterium]
MLEESEKTATTKTSNSNKRFNKALEKSDLKKDHRKATSVSKFTKKSDSPKKTPTIQADERTGKTKPPKKGKHSGGPRVGKQKAITGKPKRNSSAGRKR